MLLLKFKIKEDHTDLLRNMTFYMFNQDKIPMLTVCNARHSLSKLTSEYSVSGSVEVKIRSNLSHKNKNV